MGITRGYAVIGETEADRKVLEAVSISWLLRQTVWHKHVSSIREHFPYIRKQ
jgi:kynurenine formamidase